MSTLSTGRRLAFSLITLALVVATIELAMIVFEPLLFKGFYQYDPDLGFRVRPHAGGSNRFGFNDRDYPLHKPAGAYRVMVLGDSFNWAGGRRGNYATLLEQSLQERFGAEQVELINAGYPMTHTAEQLKLLRKFGMQLEPDLLVLAFFMGNDFHDADPQRKRIVVNDTYFDIDPRHELIVLGYPLVPHSRLLQFLRQKYHVLREHLLAGALPPVHAAMATAETYWRIKRNQLRFFELEAHRRGEYAAHIALVLDSIDHMKQLLARHGTAFAVAIYPDQLQVDGALLATALKRFGLADDDIDIMLGHRILREHLEAQAIPFVDLTDAFRRATAAETLYLERDTHWNAAGNRLAAAVLAQYLTEQTPLATRATAAVAP